MKAAVHKQPKQIIRSIIAITHVGEVRIVVQLGIGIVTDFIDAVILNPCVNIIADSAELVVFVMYLKDMILDPGDAIDDLHQQNQHRRQRQSDQCLHLLAHCSPPCGTCCKCQWRQTHRSWSPDSPYQRF